MAMVEGSSRTYCFSDQGEEGMEGIVVQIRKTINVLAICLCFITKLISRCYIVTRCDKSANVPLVMQYCFASGMPV